jgi:tetratricopeptide (TPR) repeat protein
MSVPTPAIVQAMQRASALLQAGNFPLARASLEDIVRTAPRFVEAHRLLAGALQALGDHAGAERTLRHALTLDPRWAPTLAALGELLAAGGREAEAETHLRNALAAGNRSPRTWLTLARLLNAANRPADVLDLTAALAQAPQPDLDLLTQRATALTALDRHAEAITLFRRVAAAAPGSAVAELNLAGALDAAGQHVEAEASARRARSNGANSPAATYLHATTLLASGRFDEAEATLRDTLRQDPTFADAQQNLAQLIWMRSGDLAAASDHLDATLRQYPDKQSLHAIKAGLLAGAGDPQAAHAWLGERAQRPDADIELVIGAAQAAAQFDPRQAYKHAVRAVQIAPLNSQANRLLADTLLGIGDAQAALQQVDRLLQNTPDDQHLIAVQTTAWRLLGDPRHAEFCDYAQMARGWKIDTPPGWNNLDSYLHDLAASLHRLHTLHTHPLHQSLRHGSQTTQNLQRSDDPAIRAFFTAIDGPIRKHMAAIGHGSDPLRRRNPRAGEGPGYRIKGIWSVRLRGKGYHTNHVHPDGWLSSACYIELPQVVLRSNEIAAHAPSMTLAAANDGASATNDGAPPERLDCQGWLKFGEPGMLTHPRLEAEYFIRPEPGLLALFPSYFWHGTVPFAGEDARLTIAFDLVPAV